MNIKKIKNHNIAYKIIGNGPIPVVLISGFTADHSIWDLIVNKFPDRFSLLVFDNIGIGKSSNGLSSLSIQEMAEVTSTLANNLFKQKYSIIGHSMGGAIAQSMAYHNPTNLKSLILAHTFSKLATPFKLVCKIKLAMYIENIDRKFIENIALPWAFSTQFLDNIQLPGIDNSMLSDTIQNKEGYQNQLHALLNFDSSGWLNKINIPCLILAGKDDLISPVESSENLASLIPKADLVILDKIGHVSQIENPDLFLDKSLTFLSRG